MTRRFIPLRPVPEGVLWPCGENPAGTIREFFANPADVPSLLDDGVRIRIDGLRLRFRCELTATPHYTNGDVQVRLIQEAA